MVHAAADADRKLFERAQAGRCLARVQDRRAGAGDGVDVGARECRDAGEAREQVQRGSLAREQRARVAGEARDLRQRLVAIVNDELELDVRVELAKHRFCDFETGDDPAFLQEQRGIEPRVLRHDCEARQVPVAHVLGEEGADVEAGQLHRSSRGPLPGTRTVCVWTRPGSSCGKSARK